MFDNYNDLLTVPEVCVMLSVSPSHIYKLLNRGELEGFHCRKAWRISKDKVIEYIEKLKENG